MVYIVMYGVYVVIGKHAKCKTCDGSGWNRVLDQRCLACEGKAQVRGEQYPCSECGGSGVAGKKSFWGSILMCEGCGGKGMFPYPPKACHTCKGTGRLYTWKWGLWKKCHGCDVRLKSSLVSSDSVIHHSTILACI